MGLYEQWNPFVNIVKVCFQSVSIAGAGLVADITCPPDEPTGSFLPLKKCSTREGHEIFERFPQKLSAVVARYIHTNWNWQAEKAEKAQLMVLGGQPRVVDGLYDGKDIISIGCMVQ